MGSVEREEQLLRAQAAEWLRAERRSHRRSRLASSSPGELSGRGGTASRDSGAGRAQSRAMDPFAALELPPGATAEEIAAAYRRARQALASRPRRRRRGRARGWPRSTSPTTSCARGRVAAPGRAAAAGAGGHARARRRAALAGGWLAEPLRARARPRAARRARRGEDGRARHARGDLGEPADAARRDRPAAAVAARRRPDAPRPLAARTRAIAEIDHRLRRPRRKRRGAAGAHEERAHPLVQRAAPGDRGRRSSGTSRPRAWPPSEAAS